MKQLLLMIALASLTTCLHAKEKHPSGNDSCQVISASSPFQTSFEIKSLPELTEPVAFAVIDYNSNFCLSTHQAFTHKSVELYTGTYHTFDSVMQSRPFCDAVLNRPAGLFFIKIKHYDGGVPLDYLNRSKFVKFKNRT
jgi:hypothetical protein